MCFQRCPCPVRGQASSRTWQFLTFHVFFGKEIFIMNGAMELYGDIFTELNRLQQSFEQTCRPGAASSMRALPRRPAARHRGAARIVQAASDRNSLNNVFCRSG
jgi:hypothetical protein